MVLLLFPELASAHDCEPINTDFGSPLARGTANLNFDLQHFATAQMKTSRRRFRVRCCPPDAVSRRDAVDAPRRRSQPVVIGAGNLSFEYRYLLAGGNERPFAVSINPEAEYLLVQPLRASCLLAVPVRKRANGIPDLIKQEDP